LGGEKILGNRKAKGEGDICGVIQTSLEKI